MFLYAVRDGCPDLFGSVQVHQQRRIRNRASNNDSYVRNKGVRAEWHLLNVFRVTMFKNLLPG
jgi:hypothetical protein